MALVKRAYVSPVALSTDGCDPDLGPSWGCRTHRTTGPGSYSLHCMPLRGDGSPEYTHGVIVAASEDHSDYEADPEMVRVLDGEQLPPGDAAVRALLEELGIQKRGG